MKGSFLLPNHVKYIFNPETTGLGIFFVIKIFQKMKIVVKFFKNFLKKIVIKISKFSDKFEILSVSTISGDIKGFYKDLAYYI